VHKVIIIGGMAAGCKAAARLSRLSAEYQITIVERNSIVSFGNCGLPFYASGDIDNLYELSKTAYGVVRDEKYFREVKGIKVLTNTVVEEIDSEKSRVRCKIIGENETFELQYNSLILATGSKAVKPKFPYPKSSRVSPFRSPFDAKAFREEAQKGKIKKAVIIGGGFIGCELTEAISSLWGIETILIELENSLLGNFVAPEISRIIENRVKENGIQILLSTEVKKIELDENELPIVFLEEGRTISADYVFYNLGVTPETTLAKQAGIKLGLYNGIIVDEQMRTNIPNTWAAGDCVVTVNLVTGKPDYFPLGSLSNRMGRAAADSIAGINSTFKGAAGAVSLKIFDYIICASGLTEKQAAGYGINTSSVVGCWSDRPDYYPENKDIYGKLVYEKDSLKLLGLQLVGEGEVTRYIDIFTELLSNHKTVYDLMNVEHAYTPPHSSPVSPLNYFGYMAISQGKDGITNFNPVCLSSFNGIFIDVRESSEIENLPFPLKSIQIPLSNLRFKVKDMDLADSSQFLNQSIMFICEKGPRAYEAARLFKNSGYKNISYLGGGNLLLNKSGLLNSLRQIEEEAGKVNKFSEYPEMKND
jgi:NADPH-dependent 2,4-dienoyl-CoA reductase/sulfur reductase-like enzyme/rhodanese-related sulfurtransferase